MFCRSVHHVEMSDSQFATIVVGRRIGHISLIVLQPVLNGAFVLLHLTGQYGDIATVVDHLMPVVLQQLLCIHILGVNHQSRSITVQTMYHMSRAILVRLLEIVVQNSLDIQRRVTCSHRKNADSFLDHYQPTVFIDYLHITASEWLLVTLGLRHGDLHAWLQHEIELRDRLTIDLNTLSLKGLLDFVTALPHVFQQKLKKRLFLSDCQVVPLTLCIRIVSHIQCKDRTFFRNGQIKGKKTH